MTHRRPGHAPRPRMGDAHHAAVTRELVRLTLGGRPERPELEHDVDAEVIEGLRRLGEEITAAERRGRIRRPNDRRRTTKTGRKTR